jgi:hypothetical protein
MPTHNQMTKTRKMRGPGSSLRVVFRSHNGTPESIERSKQIYRELDEAQAKRRAAAAQASRALGYEVR